VWIVLVDIFECAQHARPPVDTGSEQPGRHLPDPGAFVVEQHLYRHGQDLVFAWSAGAFFASIARQRMQPPGPDHLGQGRLIQETVQHLAAANAHRRLGEPRAGPQVGVANAPADIRRRRDPLA
jgi:hypothetical protein